MVDIQNILYDELVKFQFNKTKNNYENEKIDKIIVNNDELINKYLQNNISKNDFVYALKKNSIKLKDLFIKPIKNDDDLSIWLTNIIDLSEKIILNEQIHYLNNKKEFVPKNDFVSKHAIEVKSHGLTRIDFDKNDIQKLKMFIEQIPIGQQSKNRLIPNKFNIFYNKLISKYHLSAIASSACNYRMFPHLNFSIRYVENYKPNTYNSLENTINHELNDLHLDRYAPSITLAIYLTDVTKNDGPFQYIKGSNQYKISQFKRALQVAISFALCPTTNKNYNYEIDIDRKLFVKIPESIKCHLVIGTFINEKSEDYNYLIKDLKYILGSKGSAILFDGYSTLHTGGRPINGKRLSLFQAFIPTYKLYKRMSY